MLPAVKNAASFHGHIGPFLVVGVRIGLVALSRLQQEPHANSLQFSLRASLKVPLRTPFSCIIDGVQSTTKCTVGNQRLKLQNSQPSDITASFWIAPDSWRVTVTVKESFITSLERELAVNPSDSRLRELAYKVAALPEEHIFIVRHK